MMLLSKKSGFTLIEIMVVLGILAAVLAIGLPRMNFKQGNLKSTLRHLSVLTRQMRQNARIRQVNYRLVFDLALPPATQSYWIEVSPAQTGRSRPKEEKNETDKSNKPSGGSEPAYSIDTQMLKKPKELPNTIQITDVLTQFEQKTNLKYVYFWNNGLVDPAIIYLKSSNKAEWSLVISPLTGHSEIYERIVKLDEITTQID